MPLSRGWTLDKEAVHHQSEGKTRHYKHSGPIFSSNNKVLNRILGT